jgi:hypothetical protein
MLHSDLLEKLKAKPDGEKLFHRLEDVRKRAEPLLSRIIQTFPDYTTHDIKHSEEILEKLRETIPESLKDRLNAYEVYFLIVATYLHDIGMVNFPELIDKEKLEEFSEKEKKDNPKATEQQILEDFIRENHHLRSEKFIIENFKDLEIEDIHQAEVIGRICRGHRKENLHDMELFEPDKMYKSYPINIPLLASLLRIGDELDLTFERTPMIIYEHVPPRDDISKIEWEKHLSVSGVGLHPEDTFLIKCSATCRNPRIHRALKTLESKINKELDDLTNHLHQYREFRKDIPRKFLMEIKAEGYKPYDIKFSLQEKEIMNLLMGERLYKRKEESIRELLKNSVDACRLRQKILEKRGLSFTSKIVFQLTPDKDKLIIIDNGVGMDEDIIERYLTKIGESFYRSPEFLEKGFDFTPVSELGIGILSCFMIANKIIIETKTEESDPLMIEIDDVSDYFFVRKGSLNDIGTKVTLFLKDNAKGMNLEAQIRRYARHLEFPVKTILSNSQECIVNDVGFKFFMNTIPEWYADKHGFHTIEIRDEHVEGVIGILLRKDKKLGLIPTKEASWWLPWDTYEGKIEKLFVSNEGIFVGHSNILPEWLRLDLILVDLNLKKNALDLSVARNDIVLNNKLEKFKNRIEKVLISELQNFLRTLRQKAIEANVDFSKISKTFFGEYIYVYRMAGKEQVMLSDNILDFLKEFFYFKSLSKDGIRYIKYDEVKVSSKPIIMLSGYWNCTEEHLKQIFSECSGFTEDNFYLLSEYGSDDVAKCLLGNIRQIDFLKFLEMEESNELKNMILKTWKLARFKNYRTSRLIEFSGYQSTILNRDNRFINLLIKNKNIIDDNRKIELEGFFRTLKFHFKYDFQKVLMQQKKILKWFVDEGIIGKDQVENYILSKDDFPPH